MADLSGTIFPRPLRVTCQQDTLYVRGADGREIPGHEMSCGSSLKPLNLPAGMSSLTPMGEGRTQLPFACPVGILMDGQLKQRISQAAAVIKHHKELDRKSVV